MTILRIAQGLGVHVSEVLSHGEPGEETAQNPDTDMGAAFILGDLGKRVCSLRKLKGWTQIELAPRAGLHHVTVCRIEKGQSNIVFRDALKLAAALDVYIGALLG